MRKKFDSFGDAFGGGCGDVDAVTSIVLGSSSDVPAVDTVRSPGAAVGWCFVDEYASAGWCQWGAVVIESSVQLGFGGESGIKACRSE